MRLIVKGVMEVMVVVRGVMIAKLRIVLMMIVVQRTGLAMAFVMAQTRNGAVT
jgi:hypothetical protein